VRFSEMRKLIPVLAVLLISLPALAGSGYHAGFTGVPDICRSNLRTRPSTVAEYCFGAADGNGNVPDFSGGNLLTDRTEFDDWTQSGTCAVTADQYRNPVDGTLDADYLDNTGGAAADYRQRATTPGGGLGGRTFTGSVSIRADYDHTCTIRIFENGVAWLAREDVAVTTYWQRFSVTGTFVGGGTGAMQLAVYPGEAGISTGTAYFYGAKLVENDEFRIGMGPFINPADQSITKPPLDLTPTNDPTPAKSTVQGVDGNRVEARRLNANQYYGEAHHASMNINDTDHTYTFTFLGDSTLDAWDYLFSHGTIGADGLVIYVNASFYLVTAYANGGGTLYPACPAVAVNDDLYHVAQVVRSGNSATCYVDGVAGAPVDVTGYGIDGARNFRLGATDAGAATWDGQPFYFRLDAEALSAEERAYDREVLLGLASNQQTNALSVTRATTAYTTFADGTMAEIAPNLPRVGGAGGGLEVEAQGPNLIRQSQDFSTTWTTIAASVSTDVAMAPDGQITVDGLVGTAITNNHGVCQNEIDLTADSYVFHIWARPGDQDWIYLYLTTVANATAYFNVATGFVGTTGAGIDDAGIESAWGGFYHAWIVFTGTVAQHTFCAYSAEADGDNQFLGDGSTINTYVWQAQVEPGTFPSSIIPTTTVQVSRNADNVTLDPHPNGKPEARALPEKFQPNTPADKVTVYGEFKCRWSSSADIGGDTRWMLVTGGNTGTATWNRNNLRLNVTTSGRITAQLYDDASVSHFIQSAIDAVDYSEWFSIRAVFDLSDLSRIDMWINSSNSGMTYAGNSGTATFDTSDTLTRIGQSNAGVINGSCHSRSFRIDPVEVRP